MISVSGKCKWLFSGNLMSEMYAHCTQRVKTGIVITSNAFPFPLKKSFSVYTAIVYYRYEPATELSSLHTAIIYI